MPEEPLKSLPSNAKIIGESGGKKTLTSLPDDAEILEVRLAPSKVAPITDIAPYLTKEPKDIEPIIEELARTSRGGLMDSEKDVLRDLLTNPNLTGEQAKRGIAAIQGYDSKQSDDNTMYYLKQEDNGVVVPQALAYGERPPQGYDVARIFSGVKEAKDDSWYTDIAKSVYNGLLLGAEGALSLGQQATMAITDEESQYLNQLRNTADALKIVKDEDLNKRLVNFQGIEKASDLLDKNRYDISPESIWGTLNMLTETVVAMRGGGGLAGGVAKAAGKELSNKAAVFIGSYLAQLGDNLDAAKEIGIEGRDAAALTSVQTSAMALLDAISPADAAIFGGSARAAKKELFKKLASELPKNADGTIVSGAIGQMVKELPIEYTKMIKTGLKEYGKDVGIETVTESGQEFMRRAAEQLWDKLSADDKAKFGTDVTSPESFAAYVENGLSGLIGGGVMSAASVNFKQKYNEQSSNVFNVVKKGPEAIKELKSNLAVAKDKGTLSENEYNQAIFKVDAYDKYNEQTKDLDLSEQEKKEAFELSFNIEALKSEIPTSKEDIDKLDPIAIAKIDSKKELIKGLQKQLNEIILKEDAAKETKVGQETVNKVNKTMEPTEGETTIDALRQKIQKLKPQPAEEIDIEAEQTELKPKRPKLSAIPTPDYNDDTKYSALDRKKILQEEAKSGPLNVTLVEGVNQTIIGILPDGKRVNFAQSAPSTDPNAKNYFRRDRLPEVDSESFVDESGQELTKYKGQIPIMRLEVDAFEIDEEGNEVEAYDKDGNRKRKAVLSAFNPETGEHLGFVRENGVYKGRYRKWVNYTPSEEAQLNSFTDLNHLTDEISPYTYQPKQEKATGQPATKKKANVETVGSPRQDTYTAPTEDSGTAVELSPREKAVLAAKKPELKLSTIPKNLLKGKKVDITITNSAGEELTTTRDALKEHVEIEKELGLLEMLNKCIHG